MFKSDSMNKDALEICSVIEKAGGQPYLVGGYVRDSLLGIESKDVDIEVFKLSLHELESCLKTIKDVELVGKSFGVFKVAGCDISLPRRDSKVAPGHKGFEISIDPFMTLEDAARRRDFTMNSISMSPDGKMYDPFNGQQDLMNRILRATDPVTFIEDPLRVMRGAQFIARFGLTPDISLIDICKNIVGTMKELPGERIWDEWTKMFLKGKKISDGINFLKNIGVLRILFPEIDALIGCQQDPEWHPEGWLVSELPFNALVASMTQSKMVDGSGPSIVLGELGLSTKTIDTSTEGGCHTPLTSSIKLNPDVNGLSSTLNARSLDSSIPLGPGVTSLTEPKCFIRTFGAATAGASKIFRIMFKVSLNSVLPIMGLAVNNLKIIREIVRSVAVYVMDVFTPLKFASELQLHDDPMESRGPINSWPAGVYVTIIEVDTTSTSIDNDIIFTVDLVVCNRDLHDFMYQLGVKIGDVYTHTLMALDVAAEMRVGDREHDMQLMFGTLCHDFGKASTTKFEDGRWRARGHEAAGIAPSRTFLERLHAPSELIKQVSVLVENHLAPAHFANPKNVATSKAYRKLARKLSTSNTTMEMLYKVSCADHFGRTTPDAIARQFPAGDAFIKHAKALRLEKKSEPDVVMGRHLLEYGLTPGKEFGLIITKCREAQYDTGLTDPIEILKIALKT
jgi:tRNA nucleotidyltransferase (CCA-adding enzyme)